MNEKVKTMTH